MEASLYNRILERLIEDDRLDGRAVEMVAAACEGEVALQRALDGKSSPGAAQRTAAKASEIIEPPGAYLHTITVVGFRGVGAEATLEVPQGPGLTLVIGRNGSGKSTFAEALEMLLTAQSGRWSGARSKLWQQGWRNLHALEPTGIDATFVVEGRPPIRLTRKWAAGAELPESVLELNGAQSLDALGWATALSEFRPFISHPELGVLGSEPSQAFDQLHQVLGLGEVSDAVALLTAKRQSIEARAKAIKRRGEELQERATALASSDRRAERIEVALAKKKPALDELEAEALGNSAADEPDSEHRSIRGLSSLQLPMASDWASAAAELRSAAAALESAAADAAADHSELAQILERALSFVQEQPGTCPVCERPIEPDFAARLVDRTKKARALSSNFEQCQAALKGAQRAARTLLERLPAASLAEAETLGLAEGMNARIAELRRALERDARQLAAELERTGPELTALGEGVRQRATERLHALDDAFRPLQRDLVAWLGEARRGEQEISQLKALKAAEKWLQAQEGQLRDERFQPIAEQVKETWTLLGQQSSVALDSVRLAGKRTSRRLELGVSVDGAGSAAVGVMSQGELNALALSLFLPRMMLAQSPFRFLVIDDPVQAMDPLKVDGLARVLQRAAKVRQVIVFTHDPRLVEAVQRLQIPATIQEVTRRARSAVEVRVTGNAVQQYLSDARHVVRMAEAMGTTLVRRVVPGFCRSALEAACLQVVRRRRLGRGERHDELEQQLQATSSLIELMALAMFDDTGKASEVLRQLNRTGHRDCADTLQAVRAGAHGSFGGNPGELVRATQRLTEYLAIQS